MHHHVSECANRRASAVIISLFVAGLLASVTSACRASDDGDMPQQPPIRAEIRSGGVIEESYVYHRQQPVRTTGTARSVEPAGGWYGYGFPVSTFRWGWFGAAHYYPTVFWHDGYYGDCCRYGYRRGY